MGDYDDYDIYDEMWRGEGRLEEIELRFYEGKVGLDRKNRTLTLHGQALTKQHRIDEAAFFINFATALITASHFPKCWRFGR